MDSRKKERKKLSTCSCFYYISISSKRSARILSRGGNGGQKKDRRYGWLDISSEAESNCNSIAILIAD